MLAAQAYVVKRMIDRNSRIASIDSEPTQVEVGEALEIP